MKITILICIYSIFVMISSPMFPTEIYGKSQANKNDTLNYNHPMPILKDPELEVQVVVDGLTVPTGMFFLDKDNILVLKRYSGTYIDPLGGVTTVNIIKNGKLQEEPVLRVLSGICDNKNPPPGCGTYNERGLLGITTKKINNKNSTLVGNLEVFLYYTEITLTGEILGNRVYKYLWDGERLISPKLILDLPASPGPSHNSGKMLIGPDGYLYAVIGDQDQDADLFPGGQRRGQLQNIQSGPQPDNTSVIMRVNPVDGMPAPGNPLDYKYGDNNISIQDGFDNRSFSRYFAYGIRNSFGLAVDPITGKLWDTENGKDQYDEINLVDPGFNSGWRKIMGPISRTNVSESDLVNFSGSQYSDPEFSWNDTIGLTDLEFYNSSKLGKKYANNLFVGDYHTGNLYFFQMNKNRNGISINETQTGLSDLVADNANETSKIVLGTGFDVITDIQTGPDGDLYILSYSEYTRDHPANVSRIYKIVPST